MELLKKLIELNKRAIDENWKMEDVGEEFFKTFAYNNEKTIKDSGFKVFFNDKREEQIFEKITFHKCGGEATLNFYNKIDSEYTAQNYCWSEIKEIIALKN